MHKNLPGSELPDIRDYLFIDRNRVGSLLAQISDGLPKERTEGKSRSKRISAGIQSAFTFESAKDSSSSMSLALADLHVSELEEAAEALGLLKDVSENIRKRKDWLRGKVRKKIEPGMILRVTASTQISDIKSTLALFRSLSIMMDSSPELNQISKITSAFDAMYGNTISVSIRAAASEDFQVGFVGEIPHEHNYGPMHRELLLSQVGARPTTLTSLIQVSAVPTDKDKGRSPQDLIKDLMPSKDQVIDNSQLNRQMLDQMMTALGAILTDSGFVAAPKWPAIGVIPLAIYRQVPKIPNLDESN